MTPRQSKQIYNTICTLAYLCIAGTVAFIAFLVHLMHERNATYSDVIVSLLDIGDAGIIFYPLVLGAIIFLWVKNFIKPEQNDNPINDK